MIDCTSVPATPKKQRDSNLELYRIITMLLIIAHHYVVNSGLTAADGPIYADPLSWRSLFLLLLGAWGKIGINCFVLITGYFMCKSQISAKKFAKLLIPVMLYKILFFLLFLVTGYEPFSLKLLVKTIVPFVAVGKNFTGCYLIFFLCIPFLNILLRNLSEKMHIRLLLVMSFAYILFETLPYFSVTMNYVSWFAVLYLISSYIRLYPKKLFSSTRLWGILSLVFISLSIASVIVCTWLGTKLDKEIAYLFVTDSNTFLAVGTGLTTFLFFKNLKMKNSRFINSVAASCFGILLIHTISDTMRRWLWRDFLKNVETYSSSLLVLHALGSIVGVFVVCAIIDHLRIRWIERPLFRLWDKHWSKVVLWYQRVESAVCEKLGIHQED